MKGFLFSYGGNNDIGEVIQLGKTYQVDFPGENEICYGLAFRRNVDITFEDIAKEVTIELKSGEDFKAKLEFKTEFSRGTPEEAFEMDVKKGINSFTFPVPNLSSKIKEFVFCIFKNANPNLQTEVTILYFGVK